MIIKMSLLPKAINTFQNPNNASKSQPYGKIYNDYIHSMGKEMSVLHKWYLSKWTHMEKVSYLMKMDQIAKTRRSLYWDLWEIGVYLHNTGLGTEFLDLNYRS